VFVTANSFTEFRECLSGQGKKARFGAQQAIIVRTPDRKEEVLANHIEEGIVLTVYEAKGLEFDDVLVYNFWEDSDLQKDWRVTYKFMKSRGGPTPQFPEFDPDRHSLLSNELRNLYVAVTRSKQRLIFVDESDIAIRGPMMDFWHHQSLKQDIPPGDSSLSTLCKESTSEEWAKRAQEAFDGESFKDAQRYFKYAGDAAQRETGSTPKCFKDGERLCQAKIFEHEGRKLRRESHYREAVEKYIESSDVLRKLDRISDAAAMYMHAATCAGEGNLDRKVLLRTGAQLYASVHRHTQAASLYEEARLYKDAANSYYMGRKLSKCLEICLRAREYDLGCDFIAKEDGLSETSLLKKSERDAFLLKAASRMQSEAAEEKKENSEETKKKVLGIVELISGAETRVRFLEKHAKVYVERLITIREEKGDHLKAAQLLKEQGRFLQAADGFVKAK